MTTLPLGLIPEHHARRDPHRLAVRCGEESLDRAGFASAVNRCARVLADHGATPGSTVAIALPNGVDFLVAAFAVWRLDAVPFPLAAALPAVERDALLELAQPTVVVGDVGGCWASVTPGQWHGSAEAAPALPPPSGRHPWKLIGSGGSTGRPKLIRAGTPAMADVEQERYTIRGDDTLLIPGPLYHQGPFIFSTAGLITGAGVVLMPRFDAAEALRLLTRHAVTWTFMVPTMTHRIWRLDEPVRDAADLSSLRLLFSTGAPWPAWLKAHWIDWLGSDRVLEWYGGTEEQGGLRITGQEAVDHPGAIGRADADVRVVTADGEPAASGEVGELVFRNRGEGGHHYLGQETDTAPWRGYGDLARIDADGYVHLVDRRTDLIVSGGVNVYPAEVEAALEAHPQVLSAAVIGLPDDEWGQRVHALVQLDPGAPTPLASKAALGEHLRARLSPAKLPRSVEFVDTPLRDDAGKVRRSALREARMIAAVAP